jgi:hypothetical protein
MITDFKKFIKINEDRFTAPEGMETSLDYTEQKTKGEISKVIAIEIRDRKILLESELETLDVLDSLVRTAEKYKTIKSDAEIRVKIAEDKLREHFRKIFNDTDKYYTQTVETFNVTTTLSKYVDVTTSIVQKTNYEKAIGLLRESSEELGVAADKLQEVLDRVIADSTVATEVYSGGRIATLGHTIKHKYGNYRKPTEEDNEMVEVGADVSKPEMEYSLMNTTESVKFKKVNENIGSKLINYIKQVYYNLTSLYDNARNKTIEAKKIIQLLGEPLI